MKKNGGIVYLIGAGPGDPDLITLKGLDRIRRADAIVYDYLVAKQLLEHKRDEARVIYVGKKGGEPSPEQSDINAKLIELAGAGLKVARLKGGDPYIFGRGAEEAIALSEAGIAFETIPGVTAASAASASAGIALTHREFNTDVTFVTGHEDPTKKESTINWGKLAAPNSMVVFYMGMKNLPTIVANLIEAGRARSTGAAVVMSAGSSAQRSVVGRLDDIIEKVERARIGAPALIFVGEGVALKNRGLDWLESKPLFGKKIIVTRARAQSSDFARALRDEGADPIEFPTIETVPPDSWDPIDRAIERIEQFDWIVFTSVNGVDWFIRRLTELGLDIRILARLKIAAIGPATREKIEKLMIRVDVTPERYIAESLIEAIERFGPVAGRRFLIARAQEARDLIPDRLKELNAERIVAPIYKTIRPDSAREKIRAALQSRAIDAITFTSSSTARNFVQMWNSPQEAVELLSNTVSASIGPITSQTARELGIDPQIEAGRHDIPGLIEALKNFFAPDHRR